MHEIIVLVDTPKEAVDIAKKLRESGKYNLFRGQRKNWSVMSSLGRLAKSERKKAQDKFSRFKLWISETKGLEHYRDDADAIEAVAQHYGIPTPFVDFTTDPEVAGFFACENEKSLDGHGVLICVDENDFERFCKTSPLGQIEETFDDILKSLKFRRPITPNLWRMESQKCVFLYCNIIGSLERDIYRFDRILIRDPTAKYFINDDVIYPPQKSDLERLLDQFFSNEHRRDVHFSLRKKRFVIDTSFSGSEYLRDDAMPHGSWTSICPEEWLEGYISSEKYESAPDELVIDTVFSGKGSGFEESVFAQVTDAINSGAIFRGRSADFRIPTPATENRDDINDLVSKVWDGMRRLPYTDDQVARSIAKVICWKISAIPADKVIHNIIEVEFGAEDCSYSRAFASKKSIFSAYRPDLKYILKKEEYFRIVEKDQKKAMLMIQQPIMLFVFDKLVDLFASEIIPTQMLDNWPFRARFYSPLRLTTFGLP